MELLDKYAFPTVVAVVVSYFLLKHLWPFLKKLLEDAQQERVQIRQENREMMQEMKGVLSAHAEESKAVAVELARMNTNMEAQKRVIRRK